MKFVVDAQLPSVLAEWLRGRGYDAVAVREIGLRDADDTTICSYAHTHDAIIITKDEDFALIAATRPELRMLWVRIGNAVNRVLLARFEQAWPQIITYFEDGTQVVELR